MASSAPDTLVMQFARLPVAGRVKTRMRPVLDPVAAMRLHSALVRHTASTLCSARLGPVELWLDAPDEHGLMGQCVDVGSVRLCLQQGADLGQRMAHAVADGLGRHTAVLLVGSDCPGIDPNYLASARELLQQHDAVIGPAQDGGYVMLGLRRLAPALFQGMQWGGDTVYRDTTRVLSSMGWSWSALPVLADVDRPADLGHCHELLLQGCVADRLR